MENQNTNKVKKTIGIIVNVLLWVFVAFAVCVTIIAVSAGANEKKIPIVGGNCYMSVLSKSMEGDKPEWTKDLGYEVYSGFNEGDMIVGEYIADDPKKINKLKVADIISFEWDIDGDNTVSNGELNTHRIKEIKINPTTGGVESFITQGDNKKNIGEEDVPASAVVAKYVGRRIVGLGGMLTAFRKPAVFWCVIILPLAAFFIYELVVFIKTFMSVKNEGKKMITAEDEAVIKQRAIEEYLKMQAANASENSENSGNLSAEQDSFSGAEQNNKTEND